MTATVTCLILAAIMARAVAKAGGDRANWGLR